DDQYEWECRQRQLQREQRHRERMEEERLRPPSPPPVVHYTDHEASAVSEKIKQDETFTKAVQCWILSDSNNVAGKGDCNKRNVNNFYSMIQSTNSHVRRLLNEKTQYEEELKKAKELMKGRMQGILLQCKIRPFFTISVKLSDIHGGLPQEGLGPFHQGSEKEHRDLEKAVTGKEKEVKNVQLEESAANEKDDDEMDVSDDDEPLKKKHRFDIGNEEKNNLREENDNLRCQMEAYKNEVEVLKMDYKKDMEDKDKQFKMLQQTLQGMQQQLIDAKKRQSGEETRVKELQAKLKDKENKGKHLNDKDIITLDDSENEQSDSVSMTECSTETLQRLSECDAKLIGIISAFLNIESDLRPSDIESLMNRFPTVFKQELVGIGANIERRWMFNAFNSVVANNVGNSH
ncbi:hypothetical protein NQ317_019022, partial [Molorchus minor]